MSEIYFSLEKCPVWVKYCLPDFKQHLLSNAVKCTGKPKDVVVSRKKDHTRQRYEKLLLENKQYVGLQGFIVSFISIIFFDTKLIDDQKEYQRILFL